MPVLPPDRRRRPRTGAHDYLAWRDSIRFNGRPTRSAAATICTMLTMAETNAGNSGPRLQQLSGSCSACGRPCWCWRSRFPPQPQAWTQQTSASRTRCAAGSAAQTSSCRPPARSSGARCQRRTSKRCQCPCPCQCRQRQCQYAIVMCSDLMQCSKQPTCRASADILFLLRCRAASTMASAPSCPRAPVSRSPPSATRSAPSQPAATNGRHHVAASCRNHRTISIQLAQLNP